MNDTPNAFQAPGPTGDSSGADALTWAYMAGCFLAMVTCVCGIVGNSVAAWLLGSRMHKTPFCVYLLNLAVADILFLACLATMLILETQPMEIQSLQIRPLETQPLETQPTGTRSPETWPMVIRPLETWTMETRNRIIKLDLLLTWPQETQPPETQPMGTQPPETWPTGTRPPETWPTGTRSPETQPMGTRSLETQPIGMQSLQTRPQETQPLETRPQETQPPETQPIGSQPPETRPMGTQSLQTQPQETQPPETRPPETNLTTRIYEVVIRMKYFAYTAGLSLLTAISTQRCLSVLFPIWYKCHQPQRLPAAVCSVLWALALLLNTLASFFCSGYWYLNTAHCWSVDMAVSSLIMGVFTPVMTLTSLIIFVRVRRSSLLHRRQPLRLYVVILASVFTFLACSLPLGIYWFFLYWVHLPHKVKLLFRSFARLCSAVSCSANPVIYFLVGSQRSRRLRESLRAVLDRALQEEPELEGRETTSTGTIEGI